MLIQLLKVDIPNWWNVLAPMIEQSLPTWTDNHPSTMTNILHSLMLGTLKAWVITDKEQKTLYGLGTTEMAYDEHSGERNLIIYTLFASERVGLKMWLEAFNTISEYAKGKGCKNVSAFSNVPAAIKLAERLGVSTETRYMQWEV